MVKCNTCGGTYEPILPDGTRYFHACPPLTSADVESAIHAGTLVLTPIQRAQLDAAIALDAKEPLPLDQPSRADLVRADLAVPRPEARNENVRGVRPGGRPEDMIAAGRGITTIAPAPPPAPRV